MLLTNVINYREYLLTDVPIRWISKLGKDCHPRIKILGNEMDRGYATRIWIVNNCNSYPWKQRARGSRHLVAADLIPWYVPIRWISKLRSIVFPGLKSWATKWTVATPLIWQWRAYHFFLMPFSLSAWQQRARGSRHLVAADFNPL